MGEIEKKYTSFDNLNHIYEKEEVYKFLSNLMLSYPDNQYIKKMYDDISRKMALNERELLIINHQDKINQKHFVKENKNLWNLMIPETRENKKKNYTFIKKDEKTLFGYLDFFLRNTSKALYDFYKELANGKIIFDKKRGSSLTNCSFFTNLDELYLFVYPFETVYDVMMFIKELAYAYYKYLNNISSMDNLEMDKDIKSAIPGMFLELKFINFLIKIGKYNSGANLKEYFDYEVCHFNDLNDKYLIMKKKMGSFVAYQYASSKTNISTEDFFEKISKTNYRDILINTNGMFHQKQIVKKI